MIAWWLLSVGLIMRRTGCSRRQRSSDLLQRAWPASWSSGQGLCLLIMRSRVRFPVLPWEFLLAGKIPVVTMVWVVSRFRLKARPGISFSSISPLTSSGQRSHASWASKPQKSATLSPQPGGKPRKFIRTCGGIAGRKKKLQWASGTTEHDYILMQCGELDYSFNVIRCINLVYSSTVFVFFILHSF